MRFVSGPLTVAAFFGLVASAQAIVRIHIDLTTQSMHVSSHAGDFDWAVSTGRPGYRTPTGVYRPQRMYVMTHSSEYDDAPMPHAIFFSGGYAIHGTYSTGQLGEVASHGCVRLAPGNASALYEMVKREGATILITGAPPGRGEVAAVPERHRDGQKLAAHWRQRYRESALAYSPRRSWALPRLGDWVNLPLENQ